MPSEKIDLKKSLKQFYNPKPAPEIVVVPEMTFLMIDGIGSVESPEFQRAIEALFSVSYKAKFIAKKQLDFDYTVMPLEGLWWAEDMNDFINGRKERWKWTLMILQPDKISQDIIDNAKSEVLKKKDIAEISSLRLSAFEEGQSFQMMHIGPFSTEHDNILKMHKLIEDKNGHFDGKEKKHHEIYLSDFRKVDQNKMKTILRQPFSVKVKE